MSVIGFVIVAVVVVSAVMALRYTVPSYGDAQNYSPTDTRIISLVDRVFCQGLRVTTDNSIFGNLTLLILSSPPKLIGHETFSFSEKILFSSQPFWQAEASEYPYCYYMHPGSNFSVSACISNGESDSSSAFFLCKGDWDGDGYCIVDGLSLDETCDAGHNFSYTYQVEDDDYYCLVFSNGRTYLFESAELWIHATFNRTRYKVTSDTSIVHSCSLTDSYQSCSVGVPLSGNQTAFLTLSAEYSAIDWRDDSTDLILTCVPRLLTYATIGLLIFAGLAFIIAAIVCVFAFKYCTLNSPSCCTTRRQRSNKYGRRRYTMILFLYYRIIRVKRLHEINNSESDEHTRIIAT